MTSCPALIDGFDRAPPVASNGNRWALVADTVMGGVSDGDIAWEVIDGRPAVRLTGKVRLENNGGFVQVALDLGSDGGPIDAGAWTGIAIDIRGNGETYGVHLRTTDVTRPWQSYRAAVATGPAWRTVRLPFADFSPHRLEAPLKPARLRRIGIVAIGRAFDADVAVASLRFYRQGDA